MPLEWGRAAAVDTIRISAGCLPGDADLVPPEEQVYQKIAGEPHPYIEFNHSFYGWALVNLP